MRLIDADAFIEKLAPVPMVQEAIKTAMDTMPTVDAVPVIRCRDCKHHYYHKLLKQDYCEIPNMQFGEVNPNGYCHRAERKEE